jgi:hypothetical protein
MDQALLVERSDEINEAVSSPREDELLRELDENISEVVDGVKTAVSAIPDIQDDMEQIVVQRPVR